VRRPSALLAVALAALAAMAGLALWRAQGGEDGNAMPSAAPAPVPRATAGRTPSSRPRIDHLAADVLVAPSIHEALAVHAARRGGADRALRSLYFQAKDACWTQVVAALRRQRRPERVADPLRDWAIEELQRRCEGFPENIPAIEQAQAPLLFDIDTLHGTEAAVAQAFALLHTADNAVDLADAGETLLVNDRFPVRALFGGQDPGYEALSQGLRHAALWRECELAGRCGADSFATLAFCVQAGCRRGATLPQALREALPARDFALVLRLRAWFAAQRAAGTG
jgi:hypothetical protein